MGTYAQSERGSSRKIRISQHAYEEGDRVGWDQARNLEIESNSRYRR
jgi:hypothetical protein